MALRCRMGKCNQQDVMTKCTTDKLSRIWLLWMKAAMPFFYYLEMSFYKHVSISKTSWIILDKKNKK